MTNKLTVLLFCFFPFVLQAQEIDRTLQLRVTALLKNFGGQSGVYIKNLRSNKVVAVNADTIFPTASIVKIPILTGVMNKIEKGELQYHQELVYKDSLLYAGVDILGSYKSGEKIELSKVMMLMLTMSDNTASLWLQSLAGTGDTINRLLESEGFLNTRVNSRTPGREASRAIYGWGQTTPREIATLIEKMYTRKLINPKVSETMLRLLGRNYWDEAAISQIPSHVFVASKNGAVDDSRSEVLLVMAPHGPYIFSILTKNLVDKSWAPNNEGWVLARKLSHLLWNYYEPKSGWEPSVNVEGN